MLSLKKKTDWDIIDAQVTKYRCVVWTWTTNYVGWDVFDEIKTEESPNIFWMERSLLN